MSLAPIPALLAVLFCAALFVLLFQYLFPRPAPWKLAGASLFAGIVLTYLLGAILRQFVATGLSSFEDIATISAALHFAIWRVGLPEEATKSLAAILALLPFRRRVSPAQAFQACLFVAVGFAIVENQGYATAFGEHAVLMAFGRGFLATLTHSLLAMIFGLFLMRFAALGWRHWHLPIIGYLVTAGAHALYDAGMLPILSEYLRAMRAGDIAKGEINVTTMIAAVPVVIGGIALVLVLGLWSLRRAIRNAARDDLITTVARHQIVVRRWRWSGNSVLLLGALGLIGAIVAVVVLESPAEADVVPDMGAALISAVGFAGAIFAMILGWVLRQKR